MTKFYRIKDTELRKAIRCNEDGEKQEVIAILGKIGELMDRDVIRECDDSLKLMADRWTVIYKDSTGSVDGIIRSITYETLADAKASIPQL